MHRPLTASSILLGLAFGSAAMAQPSPAGDVFQVNTYTTGSQESASVASDAAGNFVISWLSGGSPGDDENYAILARRYASDGTALGDEFQANSSTAGSQVTPGVSVGPGGDFAVIWATIDGSIQEVQSRLFLADGAASGDDFQVNSDTTGRQFLPEIAVNSAGELITVWASTASAGTDNSGDSIQARVLDSDGSFMGSQFQVNTTTSNSQSEPDVALQPGDDFLVTWTDSGGLDGAGRGIVVRRFASDGSALGDEIVVNTYTTNDQSQPAVATDASGAFTVVWQSFGSGGGDTDGNSIQGQRFDASGQRLGAQFQVNTYTTDFQRRPDVVMSPSGEFVVVWGSEAAASGDAGSVQARLFDVDGSPVGDEVQVSTLPPGFAPPPSAGQIGGGAELVVAWASESSVGDDTDRTSLQARILEFGSDITGLAWFDSDLDGLRGAGEPPLENITVHLFDARGVLVDSTSTDASGAYRFANRLGRFSLEFEAPIPYAFTRQDAGADDSIDSDVDPATGQIPPFSASTTPPRDAGLANGLGDRAWLDENRDGMQGETEPGVAGVPVELLDDLGAVLDSTVTDADGRYSFSDLTPATYALRFTAPPGFRFTAQGQGGDGDLDSDVDVGTGETATVAFADGDILLDLDAGIKEEALFEDGFESGDTSAWSSTVP
ncbi:MAG: SdrD B-like domain-containing protein [Acidobacteriota bacterium]